jgi:hypothetical protein
MTVGIIESTVPGASATRIIGPCAQCGIEEGVWSVAWPDLPADELFLLCGRCMWRRFHAVPRGPARRALVRKVFARRIFGKSAA